MNLDDLRQWNLDRRKEDKHVYFNDKGRILCLSRSETDDYPEAKHITMTAEQLSVIDETTSVNDVLVEMDAKNESVYRIIKKTIELAEFRTKEDVLSHVLPYDNSNYDVKIDINPDKKSIEISQIRNLINNMNKSSFNSKPRFVLIDNIEYLNLNSINALLKILEEPSQNIFFFINS